MRDIALQLRTAAYLTLWTVLYANLLGEPSVDNRLVASANFALTLAWLGIVGLHLAALWFTLSERARQREPRKVFPGDDFGLTYVFDPHNVELSRRVAEHINNQPELPTWPRIQKLHALHTQSMAKRRSSTAQPMRHGTTQ